MAFWLPFLASARASSQDLSNAVTSLSASSPCLTTLSISAFILPVGAASFWAIAPDAAWAAATPFWACAVSACTATPSS